ncbi:MAG: Lpg1974 family pore-forming outer membrane protein [Pirellulaceae bacterium]|nr:hypothetical protein [Planctomycetales bacterium]
MRCFMLVSIALISSYPLLESNVRADEQVSFEGLADSVGSSEFELQRLPEATIVDDSVVPVAYTSSNVFSSRGWEAGMDTTYFTERNAGTPATNLFNAGRIWAGYQFSDVWSVRTRFWNLHTSGEAVEGQFDFNSAVLPPTGMAGVFATGISESVSAFDLEARRNGVLRNWDFEAIGGMRYANYSQAGFFSIGRIDFDVDEAEIGLLNARSKFDGVGLTFGFDASRPLRSYPNLRWVANLRGSVVGGSNHLSFDFNSVEAIAAGSELVVNEVRAIPVSLSQSQALWIGEAQLGMKYTRSMCHCAGANFFVRGLFEFQSWTSDTPAIPIGSFTAISADINQYFYGFSIGIGVER